jgi:hypothetical protein
MKTYVMHLTVIALFFLGITGLQAQARLMNKLKEKTEDKIIESIFEEDTDKNEPSQQSPEPSQASNSNTANRNTKGGGLSTDIDVIASIDNASSQFGSGNYSSSRMAIRQAMQGIELEMGIELLKSLPDEVSSLPAQKENDQVTSSGIGFAGLYIERNYRKGDQEMQLVIANNSVWISAVNMYMGSTAYANNNNEQQYKQITFQGNQGVVEYDASSGYKLSVPFGQSSILVVNGINFDTEQQFIKSCEEIKIDLIKSKLGEK